MLGSQYAIIGSGGFQLADSSRKIKMQGIPNISKIDVTLATQFLFPSDVLNSLFQTHYNKEIDQLRITSETFLSTLTKDSILSLGEFENLFGNYANFVQTKMGHLFTSSPVFTDNTPKHMYSTTFLELLQGSRVDEFGTTCGALSGEIILFDISRTLQHIRNMNVFGNAVYTYNDAAVDGGLPGNLRFLPGDLLYVENGLAITMNTGLTAKTDIIRVLEQKINKNEDIDFSTQRDFSTNDFSNSYSSSIFFRLI